jgi:hypothetical protein
MVLRNLELYRDLIRVGAGEFSIERVAEADTGELRSNGTFWDIDGYLFGLGVQGGVIVLLLGDQLVEATFAVTVQVVDVGSRRIFSAFEEGRRLCTVEYEPKKPHWNFFAMNDEDVDGFVWMNNVLASPERKIIFIGANR